MGFRKDFSDWFIKVILVYFIVIVVTIISLLSTMLLCAIELVVVPIEFIISLIIDKNILFIITQQYMIYLIDPIYIKIDKIDRRIR